MDLFESKAVKESNCQPNHYVLVDRETKDKLDGVWVNPFKASSKSNKVRTKLQKQSRKKTR